MLDSETGEIVNRTLTHEAIFDGNRYLRGIYARLPFELGFDVTFYF
jgi:hypothetical protein